MTILFTYFLLSCLAQADPIWHNLGPGGGGWIQSICASSHDPDELFVGCDVGGFYRSTDGGASYRIHNIGLQDYWVECIVQHPQDPDTIYLGCESGVYKSTDRGQTWQWLREGFPQKQRYSWSAPIGALAIDPNAPDTLYAGIGSPRRYEHGRGSVYKTTDGGSHWSRINTQNSLSEDALVSDLIIDPDDSNHLYLACQYGVYQSYDSGVNWELTTDELPHPHVRRLALCRKHPDVVYLTLRSSPGKEPWQGGVYKSTDEGKSWKPCIEGLKQYVGRPGEPGPMTTNYDRMVVHPENPDIAYVGGDAWVTTTIYKTTDGGQTWTDTVRRGEDSNIEMGWINMWGPSVKCLTMSSLDPDLLYFGTSGHVFKTTDGGQHWRQVYTEVFPDGRFRGTGLEVTCVHNITIHPKDPERLYFGYFDIGLLISDDGGKTFRRCVRGIEPRDMQNSCFDVAFDPDDPSHCWGSFGTWGQNIGVIAESGDGGMTWRIVGSPETGLPDARHRILTVDPASPPDARRLLTTADGKGIYLSEDNGHTWQQRSDGLPHGDVRDLASHPTQPGVYWCALGTGAVYYTDDWGATWRQISQNLEANDVKRLVVAPGDPRRLYLAARNYWNGSRTLPGGVYRSDDGGKIWKQVLEDDFVQGLAVDSRNADVVYAGLTDHPYHDESTGDGVMMSRDGGNTWKSINGTGLSCKQVNLIVIDPHNPDRLYLGTGGNSVFVGDVSGLAK
jgi:photosystem II stability/assembly factor-like uncharacterized protein